MAKDFFENFSAARLLFEEADELLGQSLSKIIFSGSEEQLTETGYSQMGIYVTSLAILKVVQELTGLKPTMCAGLSLGEYTALTAGGWLSFQQGLPLVRLRGQFMQEACLEHPGGMAVIMGLEADRVEQLVRDLHLPHDLWVANFNCPGQVVLSGTPKGIQAGIAAAKAHQAKRALPLQVQGAFHSGLMHQAQARLAPYIEAAPIIPGTALLVMNLSAAATACPHSIRSNLIQQVTHPVRWEQSIRTMEQAEVELYVEFGPGTTLAGMNRRIGVRAPTVTVAKVADLESLLTG